MLTGLRRLSRDLVVIVLALLVSVVLTGPVSAEMRIFELQHQPARELAEIVRTLVDENAKVATHRNTLVVNASPAELDDVARLVASFDQPLSLLRITVEQATFSREEGREVSTSGRHEDGSVTVDLGSRVQRDGSSISVGRDRDQVRVTARDDNHQEKRTVNQSLTVVEGSPARISVGRAVPFTSGLRTYWRRHPAYVETVEYHHVDTGFEVLPLLNDNMVDVEIRPFMALLDPKNPNQVVFQELATRVRVPLGAWYDLGDFVKVQDGLSREIMGGGSRSSDSDGSIRIRIDRE